MNSHAQIQAQADSVMDILSAQCADLETLLALARRETEAVERNDFEAVIRIVGERADLGERLEVYHRQIAEMRKRFTDPVEKALRGTVATRTVELAVDIQTQDTRTRKLLMTEHDRVSNELARLNQGRRSVNGYLREARTNSVAYDQRI
jgi:hypothetical protein